MPKATPDNNVGYSHVVTLKECAQGRLRHSSQTMHSDAMRSDLCQTIIIKNQELFTPTPSMPLLLKPEPDPSKVGEKSCKSRVRLNCPGMLRITSVIPCGASCSQNLFRHPSRLWNSHHHPGNHLHSLHSYFHRSVSSCLHDLDERLTRHVVMREPTNA